MYRVRTTFTGVTGTPYLNTLYFFASGGTAQQAATAAGNFWGTVDNNMVNTVSWTTDSEVPTIDPATGEITLLTAVTPVTGVGTLSGAQLPLVTQGLVRWRTGAFAGCREIRGRTFIPGLSELGNNTNGTPESTLVSAVNTAASALISDASSTFAVYSRKLGNETAVVSGSCWTQWASLRSRRD